MPAAKAAQKGGGRSKAAAARAETNGHGPTITFRRVAIPLPPKLGSEFGYRLMDVQNGKEDLLDYLRDLITPEKQQAVREAQAKDDVSAFDVAQDLMELVDKVFNAYGTSKGESSAS